MEAQPENTKPSRGMSARAFSLGDPGKPKPRQELTDEQRHARLASQMGLDDQGNSEHVDFIERTYLQPNVEKSTMVVEQRSNSEKSHEKDAADQAALPDSLRTSHKRSVAARRVKPGDNQLANGSTPSTKLRIGIDSLHHLKLAEFLAEKQLEHLRRSGRSINISVSKIAELALADLLTTSDWKALVDKLINARLK